jgi:O-antigen/teichoic acid export membrane protein
MIRQWTEYWEEVITAEHLMIGAMLQSSQVSWYNMITPTTSKQTTVVPFHSLRRRLISGGGWALGSKIVTALMSLVTTALLSRLLTPQELGAYFLAYSIVFLGASLGTLGLNQAVVRLVAESIGLNQPLRARRTIDLVFSIGALGAIGTALLYILLGNVLVSQLFNAPILAALTGLVAGWIAVTVIQRLLAETFRGFHDIRLSAIFGDLTTGLLTGLFTIAGLSFYWFGSQEKDLASVLLLSVGAGFSSALLGMWFLRGKVASLSQYTSAGVEQEDVELRGLMQVTWPLFVSNITFFIITQVDLWLIGAFLEQEQVAIYGAAARLVLLVTIPLQIINAFLPPLIAEMYFRDETKLLERTIRVTATIAGIPAFLGFALFIVAGGPIIGYIYGDYYRQGVSILVILSCGQLVNVWSGACGLTLIMTGHQRVNMFVNLIFSSLMIVTGIIAVQIYGITGLAISMAFGRAIQNIVLLLLGKKYTGMWTHISFIMLSVKNIKKMFSGGTT